MMSPNNKKEAKMERTCPRCGGTKTVKNGQANGHPKRVLPHDPH